MRKSGGANMKCWICENEIEQSAKTNRRAFCQECKAKHDETVRLDKANYAILKKKVMFERAMELMEKQGCDMSAFRNSSVKVQRYLYANWDKFDSADEIIAAIVLIKEGLQIKAQCKVGNYQVDIVIPDKKIALEIDGDRHKHRQDYDSQRDLEIKDALGDGWEIVRIGTHHIEKNCAKLVEAITAVKEKKQRLREQHCGIVPEWFDKRKRT